MSTVPGKWTKADYDRAAEEYTARLTLENIMEATVQSRQREITLASFALIKQQRNNFSYFSELLVQYFFEGNLRQVCPDNFVVLANLSEEKRGSYIADEEPPIFWTLEYVSGNRRRKDWVENRQRYQDEMKVPYYLIADPERDEFVLLKLNGTYTEAPTNDAGRFLIPELELEVGVIDGWVRYWYQGELLQLPGELLSQLEETRRRARQQQRELRKKDRQLRQRDDQLRQSQDQLRQRDDQTRQLLALLRPVVEVKAQQAGRQDILDQLATTTDPARFQAWLGELG